MKTVWRISIDGDGESPYYGFVLADSKLGAQMRLEKILGRPLNRRWEGLDSYEVFETDEEIEAEAQSMAELRHKTEEREKAEAEQRKRESHVDDALRKVRRQMLEGR